jgi:hypothetical protein
VDVRINSSTGSDLKTAGQKGGGVKKIAFEELLQVALIALFCSLSLAGCAIEQRDEVVAGVTIPIPGGMSRATDDRVEVALPGFGGGKVTYRGNVDPEEIVAFYQREMPARGWRSNASLVTRGGMLAYTKENRSVLIIVSSADRDTTLGIVVGSLGSK